jgi:hypothetical protein
VIPDVIQRWLQVIEERRPDLIDELLAEDAVFYSPAVFTPQKGRLKSATYLRAAEHMFADTNFRYIEHWYSEGTAVLEFVAELDGVHIDGVDIIHWNSSNKIVSFKVMIRPLRGLQTVIPRMRELLQ